MCLRTTIPSIFKLLRSCEINRPCKLFMIPDSQYMLFARIDVLLQYWGACIWTKMIAGNHQKRTWVSLERREYYNADSSSALQKSRPAPSLC